MTAADLVLTLRSNGAELVPAGDRIRYRPASKVPPDMLAHLRDRKAEVLALLSAHPTSTDGLGLTTADTRHVAEAAPFLAMSLDEFARWGRPLEVRVLWWPLSLWFVPSVQDAE